MPLQFTVGSDFKVCSEIFRFSWELQKHLLVLCCRFILLSPVAQQKMETQPFPKLLVNMYIVENPFLFFGDDSIMFPLHITIAMTEQCVCMRVCLRLVVQTGCVLFDHLKLTSAVRSTLRVNPLDLCFVLRWQRVSFLEHLQKPIFPGPSWFFVRILEQRQIFDRKLVAACFKWQYIKILRSSKLARQCLYCVVVILPVTPPLPSDLSYWVHVTDCRAVVRELFVLWRISY